jgi:hypothetical protein
MKRPITIHLRKAAQNRLKMQAPLVLLELLTFSLKLTFTSSSATSMILQAIES